jgi:hypothetical protein
MNILTAINKENVSQELNIPSKNLDKPREFGRDVTNNAFAEVNKDSFVGKESLASSEVESYFKTSSEETDSKEITLKPAQQCLIPSKVEAVEQPTLLAKKKSLQANSRCDTEESQKKTESPS